MPARSYICFENDGLLSRATLVSLGAPVSPPRRGCSCACTFNAPGAPAGVAPRRPRRRVPRARPRPLFPLGRHRRPPRVPRPQRRLRGAADRKQSGRQPPARRRMPCGARAARAGPCKCGSGRDKPVAGRRRGRGAAARRRRAPRAGRTRGRCSAPLARARRHTRGGAATWPLPRPAATPPVSAASKTRDAQQARPQKPRDQARPPPRVLAADPRQAADASIQESAALPKAEGARRAARRVGRSPTGDGRASQRPVRRAAPRKQSQAAPAAHGGAAAAAAHAPRRGARSRPAAALRCARARRTGQQPAHRLRRRPCEPATPARPPWRPSCSRR
jgi:hypothetical protein